MRARACWGRPLPPAAVVTVVRTVPPAVAGFAVLTVAPSVAVAALGGGTFTEALSAASLIAGAGLGFAADDPAAPTVASSPTTLAVRRILRAAGIAVGLGLAWLTAILIAGRYSVFPPKASVLIAEFAAAAALSLGFAALARTDQPVKSGFGATIAALVTVMLISSLAYRWVQLPAIGGGSVHARWWWVAIGGLVVAALGSADPARRRRRRSRS